MSLLVSLFVWLTFTPEGVESSCAKRGACDVRVGVKLHLDAPATWTGVGIKGDTTRDRRDVGQIRINIHP